MEERRKIFICTFRLQRNVFPEASEILWLSFWRNKTLLHSEIPPTWSIRRAGFFSLSFHDERQEKLLWNFQITQLGGERTEKSRNKLSRSRKMYSKIHFFLFFHDDHRRRDRRLHTFHTNLSRSSSSSSSARKTFISSFFLRPRALPYVTVKNFLPFVSLHFGPKGKFFLFRFFFFFFRAKMARAESFSVASAETISLEVSRNPLRLCFAALHKKNL